MISECEMCDHTRIPSSSKSGCYKPPFDQCGIVDDKDLSRCQECLDNDHFYLVSRGGEQACVPRLNRNYSTKCLEYFPDSKYCKKCASGLKLSLDGCFLEDFGDYEQSMLQENEDY